MNKTGRIHLLAPIIFNKIAAGEVIERPASVVKELVENSLDAGSTRIGVDLLDGGKKLIKVVDNGVGMCPEDLSMVFLKHATSKITSIEDLMAISTMGFRGEALASIGSVSQAKIISCAHGEGMGAEIEVKGGKRGELRYVGAPEGTQVEVRELFYNIPARRKFLKATPAEMAHISEVLTRLALSHPELQLILTHNDREVFNLPPVSSLRERIVAFFGGGFADGLMPVKSREQDLEVSGYALPPSYYRTNTRMQFIFLNGRCVREPGLAHAINEAYRNLLPPGRFPGVFLVLQIDPTSVDVNVHPTKMEVRFRDAARVHAQVLQTLRRAITQVTPSFSTAHPSHLPAPGTPDRVPSGEARLLHPSSAQFLPEREIQTQPPSGGFVQLHMAYIVEEVPGGLNIIDQHALHEALLYQEMRRTLEEKPLPGQHLLIPELLELSPERFFSVTRLKETLSRLGLEIEEFGRNSIIVRSVPQILKEVDTKELVEGLLEDVHEGVLNGPASGGLDSLIKVMACKGAVKSGRRLSYQEVRALLEKRGGESLSHCPHGRPTTLFFSLEELDKQFKRRGK